MGSDMPTHTPSENIHENGRHGSISEDHNNVHVIPRMSLQELLSKSAPGEQIDSAVEDFLLDLADDFVDSVTSFACKLAAHRRSDCLQVKDIKVGLLFRTNQYFALKAQFFVACCIWSAS
mmetsp:Transcript_11559/g.52286  ORF Transcript_11559/g.52286 Transcript_11559/m.52286 type:complete len:120 (-) Transcript_11559:991-1350(-)